jgi:hypothetical protein
MKYYRRYDKDGNCEVICTNCFVTLGMANQSVAIRRIEEGHICRERLIVTKQKAYFALAETVECSQRPARHPFGLSEGQKSQPFLIAILGALFFLYVMPTVGEFIAAQHVNPWLAIILPGDLLGCIWLTFAFRMQRTGVLLYLLLTGCESFLYLSHAVTVNMLVWIADSVPTLLVAVMIARSRMMNTARLALS